MPVKYIRYDNTKHKGKIIYVLRSIRRGNKLFMAYQKAGKITTAEIENCPERFFIQKEKR